MTHRQQGAKRADEAQTVLEDATNEVKDGFVGMAPRTQRIRTVKKVQKTQSSSPYNGPSKLVDEYLADPSGDDLKAGDENLEVQPSSSCEMRAKKGDLKLKHLEASRQKENLPTGIRCSQDLEGSNQLHDGANSKYSVYPNISGSNKTITHSHQQEPADLEFLMSGGRTKSIGDHHVHDWPDISSSSLSDLSAEDMEKYIATLKEIVDEEETGLLSLDVDMKVMADRNLLANNLETESEAKGVQSDTIYKNAVPQRVVRRRCLDFEATEGRVQAEVNLSPVEALHMQDISSRGEATRALAVLKKRVSTTLSAGNSKPMSKINVSTESHSRKDGAEGVEITCPTSVNMKLSCDPSFEETESSPAKSSPMVTAMPSGIGLHLNSLSSSLTCAHPREVHRGSGLVTSVRPGITCSGGFISSNLQRVRAESTQKSLPCLNPGKHMYSGSLTDSEQRPGVPLSEAILDDYDGQSECSDQDKRFSAVQVHTNSLAASEQVQDIVLSSLLNNRSSSLSQKRLLSEDSYQIEVEKMDCNTRPYSPKKKRRSSLITEKPGDGCKRCNCKKSKCLKLYCDCFAAGVYCVDSCACQGCFNKPEFEETVLDTRQQIESRNPLAFAPKIIRAAESSPTKGDESRDTSASARHKRGCNCKRSFCLKKYCECFQAGVGCSDGCRCENCKNVHGRKEGSHDFTENDLQMESMVMNEHREDQFGNPEHYTEAIHGSQSQSVDLSPITPAFQHGEQHRLTTNSSLEMKKYASLEPSPSFSASSSKSCKSPSRLTRSPSRVLRTCKERQNSASMSLAGVSLSKSGVSPSATPRILRIGRFSPRWDGLDEICTFTPGLQAPLRPAPASASIIDRTEFSPSLDEHNHNDFSSIDDCSMKQRAKLNSLTSPVCQQRPSQCLTPTSTHVTAGFQTPCTRACGMDNDLICEDSKAYYTHQLMEDKDTPDFLKDSEAECLLPCLLNSNSPKHKRVSPPHHHHANRGPQHQSLQSPGLRSSRKFILQSIPSVPPTPLVSAHDKPKGNRIHN
ncbi:hypothetical protein KP509_02G109700 [Ceratopteris richardii]|uniref:CRC domain-containing protein n=1 Tax=Ceratopteris richardii TaxID=49495 RepID=A0A8T2VGK0_CERRI|nr:hypothetical protein KP509_02G109700 [Ceratopteris richardii]